MYSEVTRLKIFKPMFDNQQDVYDSQLQILYSKFLNCQILVAKVKAI
ncbi:24780_t:CDS:2, partial [Gigaspora rosea]